MKVYVASSWKNEQHPEVVKALKRAGHDAYDFKAAETAFRWDAFTPMQLSAPQRFCSEVLPSEMAQKAFVSDMAALRGADATVLVAPCGGRRTSSWALRSAPDSSRSFCSTIRSRRPS